MTTATITVAERLYSFAKEFDPYEYMDFAGHEDDHIEGIAKDLDAGDTLGYREFLFKALDETEEFDGKWEIVSLLRELERIE